MKWKIIGLPKQLKDFLPVQVQNSHATETTYRSRLKINIRIIRGTSIEISCNLNLNH